MEGGPPVLVGLHTRESSHRGNLASRRRPPQAFTDYVDETLKQGKGLKVPKFATFCCLKNSVRLIRRPSDPDSSCLTSPFPADARRGARN